MNVSHFEVVEVNVLLFSLFSFYFYYYDSILGFEKNFGVFSSSAHFPTANGNFPLLFYFTLARFTVGTARKRLTKFPFILSFSLQRAHALSVWYFLPTLNTLVPTSRHVI